MPSKKPNNKGRKSEKPINKDNELESEFQEIQQKENTQVKPKLKYTDWTQDDYSLDVIFFAGKKLKGDDIDATFTEQACDLKLSDGREWHVRFFKPIDMKASRVQLKGFRLHLKVRKQTSGHWLDVEYVPGQSEPPSPTKTAKSEPQQTTSKKPKTFMDSDDKSKVTSNQTKKSPANSESEKESVNSVDKDQKSVSDRENYAGMSLKDQIARAHTGTAVLNDGGCTPSPPSQSMENKQNAISTDDGQCCAKPDITDLLAEEDKSEISKDNMDDSENTKDSKEENVHNLLHVKNDFFEKTVAKANDTMSVQIFVKQMIKESLQVSFEGRDVSVKFSTRDSKFLSLQQGTDENTVFGWKIEVVDLLLESQCKYRLTGNYLELTLRKKEPRRWAALEAVHTKGKIMASSEWVSASNAKSTVKTPPTDVATSSSTGAKSTVIFDEMQETDNNKKTSEWAENQKNAAASTSKGYVLGDGTTKDSQKKPTCMVSPLKPPKEKQVVSPGYTGLDNLGNTCFMNSVLQVLANTTELRDYFLDGHFQKEINVDNPLGSGGKIAVEFAMLLKVLWSGTRYSYAPTNLKKLVAQKKSMFMGFAQHDAQEYMSFLLDGLHEDVNKIKKKPYIEQIESDDRPDEDVASESWSNHKKRNDSFLVDLFQGQYKSTLVCPVCDKVSVTFDPFMHLPVPLPKKQRLLTFIFMSRDPRRKPVKYMIRVPKGATVEHLKESIFQRTNVESKNLRVFEAYQSKIQCIFEKGASLSHIQAHDKIIVHEVLSEKLAGEPVTELIVVQRLSVPVQRPTRCACCRTDEKEGQKLLRCTRCFRVGYCKTECQKQHWPQHKNICRSVPDTVGTPFMISLPKSQTTFSRISQMAEMYSRYSVDVFQPPQESTPSSACSEPLSPSSSSESAFQVSNGATSSDANMVTSDYNSASSLSNESASKSFEMPSASAESLGTDTVDSGRETDSTAQLEDEDANNSCAQNNAMVSSVTSSQDTESSAGDAGTEPMSVSTSSTSLSSYSDENTQEDSNKGKVAETKEDQSSTGGLNKVSEESAVKSTPTRIVMGRQQDPEKPAPQFHLKPCDKAGNILKDRKKFVDLGEDPLDLNGVELLGMDWKNSEKDRPFVQVTSKTLVYDDDPNLANVISEENKNMTIQQCLSLFTEPEVLNSEEAWYCPKCKKHREASKQLSLWRLPNVLIIQLKRFSYRNLLWCDKVEKIVDFPQTGLDMSSFFDGKVPDSEPSPIYDLYGVVNHYGGIMGGHYTAYTRCVSAQDPMRNEIGWRSCDDSHVSNTTENQVVTRAGYVLFYRRRDTNMTIPSAIKSTNAADYQQDTISIDKTVKEPKLSDKETDNVNEDDKLGKENEPRPIFTISPEGDDDDDDTNHEHSSAMAGMLDNGTMYSTRRVGQRSNSYTSASEYEKSKTAESSYINNDDIGVPKSYSDMDSVD